MINNYKAYINQQFQSIVDSLDSYREAAIPEDLHRFRVTFKKIKALYHLNEYCNPEQKAGKSYRKIKKLFRLSGKLRDDDTIQALLKKHHIQLSESEIKAEKKKREQNLKKFLKYTASVHSDLTKLEKHLIIDSRQLSKVSVQSYIEILQEDIRNNIHATETVDGLHNLRKKIKELSYITAAVPGLLNLKTLNFYNRLQESIGKWHDKVVLKEYLENIQSNFRKPIHLLTEQSINDLKKIQLTLASIQG